MFYSELNKESTGQVVISFDRYDFEDNIKYKDEYIDKCTDIIYSLPSKFENITNDCIDKYEDYYFSVMASSDEEANTIADFLNESFENVGDNYCYQDDEEEDDEDEE